MDGTTNANESRHSPIFLQIPIPPFQWSLSLHCCPYQPVPGALLSFGNYCFPMEDFLASLNWEKLTCECRKVSNQAWSKSLSACHSKWIDFSTLKPESSFKVLAPLQRSFLDLELHLSSVCVPTLQILKS